MVFPIENLGHEVDVKTLHNTLHPIFKTRYLQGGIDWGNMLHNNLLLRKPLRENTTLARFAHTFES